IIVTACLYVVLAIGISLSSDLPSLVGLSETVYWLVPFGALLLGWRDSFYVLQLRRSRFTSMAFMDFWQSGTLVASRIGWGISIGSTALGLVLGHLAGLLVAAWLAWKDTKQWLRSASSKFSPEEVLSVASRYQDYPRYRLPAHLVFMFAE